MANPSAFPLQERALTFQELMDYPILMLSRSTTSEYLYSLFSNRRLKLIPEVELSSNDLLIDLARIGLGSAFVPEDVDKRQFHTRSVEGSTPPLATSFRS